MLLVVLQHLDNLFLIGLEHILIVERFSCLSERGLRLASSNGPDWIEAYTICVVKNHRFERVLLFFLLLLSLDKLNKFVLLVNMAGEEAIMD